MEKKQKAEDKRKRRLLRKQGLDTGNGADAPIEEPDPLEDAEE